MQSWHMRIFGDMDTYSETWQFHCCPQYPEFMVGSGMGWQFHVATSALSMKITSLIHPAPAS